jgi:hypothetical protein
VPLLTLQMVPGGPSLYGAVACIGAGVFGFGSILWNYARGNRLTPLKLLFGSAIFLFLLLGGLIQLYQIWPLH